MPRPPKLTRQEVKRRAALISERYLREVDEPLGPRHAGAIVSSLAREASRSWDEGYWRFDSAHQCALGVVRRYRWSVPQQIWDMLSAWALLDVCGAVGR